MPRSPALATSLARLKNSLELGPLGTAVKQTDPVPLKTYETLGKVGSVFSNPERAQKFLTFPGARELSEHPKIVALRDDPDISEMIAQGRFLDLLQNQRIIDAANDPTLADRIKKFDLQKALDYAMEDKDKLTQSPQRTRRQIEMTENEIAKQILDAAFVVHTKLGPGLLESVYEVVLAHELKKKGLVVERQKPMAIVYDGIRFDEAYRSDLLVNSKVIVELKSAESVSPLHAKQLLTQLRMSGLKLGLFDQLRRGPSQKWHQTAY